MLWNEKSARSRLRRNEGGLGVICSDLQKHTNMYLTHLPSVHRYELISSRKLLEFITNSGHYRHHGYDNSEAGAG